MKFHKQRFRHRPEQGEFGDCCRTVYACLLGFEPEDIPNFGVHYADRDAFHEAERGWLNAIGYTTFLTGISGEWPLDQVLAFTKGANAQAYLMLTGTSRTGCNHVVIVKDGEIIHDPSLDDAGIIGPAADGNWWIEAITPLLKHNEFPPVTA